MSRIRGEWEGVPGWWYDDDTSPDKKRFLATKYGWAEIRRRVWVLDRGFCQGKNCPIRRPIPLKQGQVHHMGEKGRGLGGSVREDRIFVPQRDGALKRNLMWVCVSCHDRIERPAKVVPAKELVTDVCRCGVFRERHPTERCPGFAFVRRATRLDLETELRRT